MFERFSSSYFVGRLYVEPTLADPKISRAHQEEINSQLQDERLQKLDEPIVMKIGTNHLLVDGDRSTPQMTLEVPVAIIEDTNIRNPPTLKEIFLLEK